MTNIDKNKTLIQTLNKQISLLREILELSSLEEIMIEKQQLDHILAIQQQRDILQGELASYSHQEESYIDGTLISDGDVSLLKEHILALKNQISVKLSHLKTHAREKCKGQRLKLLDRKSNDNEAA